MIWYVSDIRSLRYQSSTGTPLLIDFTTKLRETPVLGDIYLKMEGNKFGFKTKKKKTKQKKKPWGVVDGAFNTELIDSIKNKAGELKHKYF